MCQPARHAASPTIELAETQVRKQAVVDRLVGGLEALLKRRTVTIVPGDLSDEDIDALS